MNIGKVLVVCMKEYTVLEFHFRNWRSINSTFLVSKNFSIQWCALRVCVWVVLCAEQWAWDKELHFDGGAAVPFWWEGMLSCYVVIHKTDKPTWKSNLTTLVWKRLLYSVVELICLNPLGVLQASSKYGNFPIKCLTSFNYCPKILLRGQRGPRLGGWNPGHCPRNHQIRNTIFDAKRQWNPPLRQATCRHLWSVIWEANRMRFSDENWW